MRKLFIFLAFLLLILAIGTWFLSKEQSYEPFDAQFPDSKYSLATIEEEISLNESIQLSERPKSRARIVWTKGKGIQSEWSIVYLHSIQAGPAEAESFVSKLGDEFGMNVFFARIDGLELKNGQGLKDLTPKKIVDSVKEALAIGQTIGKKVMVIGSSTAAVPAVYIASQSASAVDALVLYAPVLETNEFFDKSLLESVMLQPSQWFSSENNKSIDIPKAAESYSSKSIPIDAVKAYTHLMNETMTDANFSDIKQPYFISYYFKDEQNMDEQISIEAIDRLDSLSQTSTRLKRIIELEKVKSHILIDRNWTDKWQKVYLETKFYIEEVLKVKPKTVL